MIATEERTLIGPEAPLAFSPSDLSRARVLCMQIPEVPVWRAEKVRPNGKLDRAVTAVIDLSQLNDEALYFADELPQRLGVDQRTLLRQLLQRVA
ncbi:MAG: hypothetical protein V4611_00860 [Patescibacteria group bacterium]